MQTLKQKPRDAVGAEKASCHLIGWTGGLVFDATQLRIMRHGTTNGNTPYGANAASTAHLPSLDRLQREDQHQHVERKVIAVDCQQGSLDGE